MPDPLTTFTSSPSLPYGKNDDFGTLCATLHFLRLDVLTVIDGEQSYTTVRISKHGQDIDIQLSPDQARHIAERLMNSSAQVQKAIS